jgi:hypothetical protein
MDVLLETGLLDDCAASATHQGSTHKTYTVSEPYLLLCPMEPIVSVVINGFYPKKQGLEKVLSTCSLNLPHTVKKFSYFPVPSRDVTNQLFPARESLVSDIPAGDGKIAHCKKKPSNF